MNIRNMKIGSRLDLELINSLGERIGQVYVSQLVDIINEKNITISAPIHESRLMFISSGTRVRIIILHDKFGLHSFVGVISSREKRDNLFIFNVEVQSDLEKIQRRKFFRLDCNLDGLYRISKEDPANPNEQIVQDEETPFKKALTRNISGNGAGIVVEEEVPFGELVELVINLSSANSIKSICKVVRCSKIELSKGKKYELGLYFKKISSKDQDALIRFIFDQQRHLLKLK